MIGLILTTAMVSLGGGNSGYSPTPAPERPCAEAIERAVVQAPDAAADKSGLGWTLIKLDLDVTIVPGDAKAMFKGEMTLRLDGESSLGPTIAINARAPLMRFGKVESQPAGKVETNVQSPTREHTRLTHIRFDKPLRRGDTVRVRFAYESSGRSKQFAVADEGALASWVEAWHPIPLPSPGTTLSRISAAVGTTRFHLPPDWHALSNGDLVESRTTKDATIETWKITRPVARSFAAGPYTVASHDVDGRKVRIYRLGNQGFGAPVQAKMIGQALRIQEKHFGPYPYASYGIAEVPQSIGQFYAASEQGFIMAKPGAFDQPDGNLALFSHEMSHGWWGNLIGGSGPGKILCSESLAQYSAVLAIEGIDGVEAATLFMRFSRPGYSSKQCARGYFQLWREGNDKPLSRLTSGGWQHTLSDAKGHWVYHMLRRRVGDERFFATLRKLIKEFAGKPMSLDDLRAAFVAAAPEAELERFFAQWLDRPGAPILDVEWEFKGEGNRADVIIRQSQAGEPYHLNLDVAVESAGGTRIHTIEVRERETRVTLNSDGKPTDVRLDPRHRLLIWTAEYGPRPDQPASPGSSSDDAGP